MRNADITLWSRILKIVYLSWEVSLQLINSWARQAEYQQGKLVLDLKIKLLKASTYFL